MESNFVKFFTLKFEFFGLKKFISTSYNKDGHGKLFIYSGDKNENLMPDVEEFEITDLQGDGSFDSPECIELLKESDIIVTNPPFSLYRRYMMLLMDYDKKFLVIANFNSVGYKEIFPYIKDDKMWVGYNPRGMNFYCDFERSKLKVVNSCWFTNLEVKKRYEELVLWKSYNKNPQDYPKYDNYEAIEVSKTVEIPYDYDGVIGVPISFLDKYNPNQFEIIKFRKGDDEKDLSVNGKCPYYRILIRRNKEYKQLIN